ncbi:MAG TPA: tyrosinase family protein [Thermoanaerobaculia bacterium]|jgi:hypothetical protein|nr:tyrosinase family protein [Thermoanaerobaculia bacterium]
MPINRRIFIRQTLSIGPVAMAFWLERDLAWGADGQCGLPDPSADCTLPSPRPAQRFIPNEPKVQTRHSALEMAAPGRAVQLKQFRDAICLVRNLPKNDVIGWTKQVAQHCIQCDPANTSNIHFDWQFLPWHRGLLYFLERILRKLSNHDDLRLVYWDWENPGSRHLPAIYAPSGQPLYWANRRVTGAGWPLPNGDVNVQPLLGVPNFRVFGGTATQSKPVPAVFSGPHANVHNAFDPGDMADLQFSPRDPVFYAHHGNIDRLWSSWVAAGHGNPDFGDTKVFFYDENREWRFVLANDLRDETKLGYKYSSLMHRTPAAAAMRALPLSLTANHLALAPQVMASIKPSAPAFLIVENLHNPEQAPPDTVKFGIFHGSPPVGTQSDTYKGFLGVISRVRTRHSHPSPLSAVLDVSGKLGALAQANKGALNLMSAPLDAGGKTTAPASAVVADSLQLIA